MSSSSSASGVGFWGLLTIAFIVLKLCGVINWSWLWVLAPLWIGAAIIGVCLLLIFVLGGLGFVRTRKRTPYSNRDQRWKHW